MAFVSVYLWSLLWPSCQTTLYFPSLRSLRSLFAGRLWQNITENLVYFNPQRNHMWLSSLDHNHGHCIIKYNSQNKAPHIGLGWGQSLLFHFTEIHLPHTNDWKRQIVDSFNDKILTCIPILSWRSCDPNQPVIMYLSVSTIESLFGFLSEIVLLSEYEG